MTVRVIRGVVPVPHLRLFEIGRQLNVQLKFRYAEDVPFLRPGGASFEAVKGGSDPLFVYRHHEAEGRAAKFLKAVGLSGGVQGAYTALGEQAWRFLLEELPRVRQAGWTVSGLEHLVVYQVALEPPVLIGRIAAAGRPPSDPPPGRRGAPGQAPAPAAEPDRFELELEVAWGDRVLPAAAVRNALAAGRRFIPIGDGRYGRITEDLEGPLATLHTALRPGQGGRLQFDRARVPFVDAMLEKARVEADAGWTRLRDRLRDVRALEPLRPPATLHGTLRPYQEAGLGWLAFLRDLGLGGILADDMGLGKTVQVLALLLAGKEAGVTGPSLVVAPASVVLNWEAEARRFTPSLEVLPLHGPNRHRRAGEVASADLVVTSYTLLRRDLDQHLDQSWRFVILDEAQHIKNPASQTAKAARRLRAAHRLALTGTPIENRLEELWSQFAFVMPQLLGTLEGFKQRYIQPIEQLDDRGRRDELKRRVKPFILRRLKEEVAPELPPRTEAVMRCELQGVQRRLYNAVLKASRSQIQGAMEARGFQRARLTVLAALLRLRQVCCDPHLLKRVEGLGPEVDALLEEHSGALEHRSAKMQLFHEMLREVLESGHRVLVFSQFVQMLRILREDLDKHGVAYEYLDGQTVDRLDRVNRFNAGSTPVFLISLKAGGTGLNLTGADYVIHFDPWWNPAVEAQATDRAHRIGQTRPVFSYKLIAADTVEERMLELQARKRVLAAGVLDEGGLLRALTREDLEFLLRGEG